MDKLATAHRLTARLTVRMTPVERARLARDADAAGLSITTLLRRRLIASAPVAARTDDATVRELRRLGGLVKHIHFESNGAYSASTAAALTALGAAIDRIAARNDDDAPP
jgi:hypothetical protein